MVFALGGAARDIVLKTGIEDHTGPALANIQKRLGGLANPATLAAGAVAGIGRALIGITSEFAKTGDAIHKMSIRTGVSATELSKLKFAASQSGTSLSQVERGIQKMTAALADAESGTGRASRAMDSLNLSAEDFQGLSADEQLRQFADAIAALETPTERLNASMEIFGRRVGPYLIPLLEQGSEGIQELGRVAEQTGNIIDDAGAQSAANYTDAMDKLNNTLEGVGVIIGEKLAPLITAFADVMSEVIPTIIEFIEKALEPLEKAVNFVGDAWAALSGKTKEETDKQYTQLVTHHGRVLREIEAQNRKVAGKIVEGINANLNKQNIGLISREAQQISLHQRELANEAEQQRKLLELQRENLETELVEQRARLARASGHARAGHATVIADIERRLAELRDPADISIPTTENLVDIFNRLLAASNPLAIDTALTEVRDPEETAGRRSGGNTARTGLAGLILDRLPLNAWERRGINSVEEWFSRYDWRQGGGGGGSGSGGGRGGGGGGGGRTQSAYIEVGTAHAGSTQNVTQANITVEGSILDLSGFDEAVANSIRRIIGDGQLNLDAGDLEN